MKEYLQSAREVTQIALDAGRLLLNDALEWMDQKLADACDLGGED